MQVFTYDAHAGAMTSDVCGFVRLHASPATCSIRLPIGEQTL